MRRNEYQTSHMEIPKKAHRILSTHDFLTNLLHLIDNKKSVTQRPRKQLQRNRYCKQKTKPNTKKDKYLN